MRIDFFFPRLTLGYAGFIFRPAAVFDSFPAAGIIFYPNILKSETMMKIVSYDPRNPKSNLMVATTPDEKEAEEFRHTHKHWAFFKRGKFWKILFPDEPPAGVAALK
jgi:hypothetical protein